MKRSILSFIIFITFLFSCLAILAHGNDMKITKDKAIEIANKEAKRLGYNIQIQNIKITKYDTPWNEYLPKETIEEYYIERKNKLRNREYWAVYYYPNREKVGEGHKGGDFCLFIDAHTGEVITEIRWK